MYGKNVDFALRLETLGEIFVLDILNTNISSRGFEYTVLNIILYGNGI